MGARDTPVPTPAGTQRRLRALAARGWSPETIERVTGLPADASARALDRGVSTQTAARVAAVYDALWDQQPPLATDADRKLAAAAAGRARSARWAPPLAWDDDELDRDDAKPAAGWQRSSSRQMRSAAMAEDAAFVREHGGYRHASVGQVAMRLGVSRAALEKALTRAAHAQHDREAV
jgi:hypothetical protein